QEWWEFARRREDGVAAAGSRGCGRRVRALFALPSRRDDALQIGHVDGAAQGRPPVLLEDLKVHFLPVHRDGPGGVDAQLHLVAPYLAHRHPDVVADHDALVAPPRQHQHAGVPPWTCRDAAAPLRTEPSQTGRPAPGGPIPTPGRDVRAPVFRDSFLPRARRFLSHILAGDGRTEPAWITRRLASLNRRMVSMASAIAGVPDRARKTTRPVGSLGLLPTRPAICTSDRAL